MLLRTALNRAFVGGLLAGLAFGVGAQTQPAGGQPAGGSDASAAKGASSTDPTFAKADANSDGKLTKEEAAKVPAVAAKWDQLDKDKKGYLTAEEFSKAMKP